MATRCSSDAHSAVQSSAVLRLFGGLRGWLEGEIHAIRVAQLDDAFFATAKGMQYEPTRHSGAPEGGRPSAS